MHCFLPLLSLALTMTVAADERQKNINILSEIGVAAEPTDVIQFLQPPDAKLVAQLIQQLGTDSFQEREEAMRELLQLRVLPRDALVRTAQDKDPERAYRANYVLKHAPADQDEALLAALKLVRGDAYEKAAPVLIELIGHLHQPRLVAAAARALQDVARPRDEGLMQRSLRSTKANVRAAAAVTLAAVVEEAALDDLRPLLSDADDRVRLAVALAMVNNDDRKALVTLGKLLSAEDINMRVGAVRAIRSMSENRFGYLACDQSSSRPRAARAWQAWIAELKPQSRPHVKLDTTAWANSAIVVQGSAKATLTGHTNEVPCVLFSPDGKTLATASWDHTVQLWEAETGKPKHTLRGHTNWVRSLAFSPDGKRLLTGSVDTTIRDWDIATGVLSHTINTRVDKVFALAFSPDGLAFASGADGGVVKIWDPSEWKTIRLLKHFGTIRFVAYSHDGRTIASASAKGTIKLWDAATGRERATLKGHDRTVWSVAFSPDDLTLASAGDDHTIRLWDVRAGHERITLSSHQNCVWSVAFSPDGKVLASSSSDRTIKLWDVEMGDVRQTLAGHRSKISYVDFSPDGRILASASADRTAKLWQIEMPATDQD